jgi:GNAT superfamily N-acetyltransferase
MIRVRRAQTTDAAFVFAMTTVASFPPDVAAPSADDVVHFPHANRWREPMRRAGDGAVIAERSRVPIGAAVYRLFEVSERPPLLELVDLPEIAIAIVTNERGRGSARTLLTALQNEAKAAGELGLALVVSKRNVVAERLYRGCGFETVSEDERTSALAWSTS